MGPVSQMILTLPFENMLGYAMLVRDLALYYFFFILKSCLIFHGFKTHSALFSRYISILAIAL